MPDLIHKRGDGTQKSCVLGEKPLIIGRLPESEIQVRDAFISRVHASINYSNNSFIIKDLGSTNGTYRNGSRVYECNLANGDRIQVGNAALVFEIDATTGNGVLSQAAVLPTAPRQVVVSGAAATALPNGVRPSELKTTIPVQIPPPTQASSGA